jgi:hypothetical protein
LQTPVQAVRLQQAVEVNDKVSHHRIIDGALGGAFPGYVSAFIVGVDPDDIETFEVTEFVAVEGLQLAAENKMQKLGLGIRHGGGFLQFVFS